MNKKGGILIPVITIFALIVLLYAAFSIYSGKNNAGTEKIGKLQLEIIDLQQEAEGRLFYLDQLAKYAAQKTNNELRSQKFTSENAFLDEFSRNFESEFMADIRIAYFDVPTDYKFKYEYKNSMIKIDGEAGSEIVLKGEHAIYGVKHHFVQEIEHKFNEKADKQLF